MAGRPKLYEEDVLIEKATEVFWKKGYTASSAQDLMEVMNVGQGSLYRTFKGGKQELYQKTLINFLKEPIKVFYQNLEHADNPIQFIKAFFYKLLPDGSKQKRNGCYLGNAIVEQSNLDDEIKLIAAQQLDKLRLGFEKALQIAQEKGHLTKDKSPQLVALHLINLWNGFNITQRMELSSKACKDLLDESLKILD